MTREELRQKCFDVHILSYHNNSIKVNPQWYKIIYPKLDKSFKEELDSYLNIYRTKQEAFYCLKHDIIEIPKCKICGAPAKFNGKCYGIVCEDHNANQVESKKIKCLESFNKNNNWEDVKRKARQTRLERYGDANYSLYGSKSFKENMKEKYGNENYHNQEKIKETCLKKYGVTCNLSINSSERSKRIWSQKHDNIVNKSKLTSLNKYGVDHFSKTKDFSKSFHNTIMSHYGSLLQFHEYVKKRSKETLLKRYNNENYNNINKIKETIYNRRHKFEIDNNCTIYDNLTEKYGQGWHSLNLPIIYDGRYRYISNKYIKNIEQYASTNHNLCATSKEEKELLKYIKTLTKEKCIENTKNVIKIFGHKAELDIYIPTLKIAIEFNGDYFHCEINKPYNYHQEKTKACYKMGIMLVHIYEFEWKNNKEKIKLKLKELFEGKDCSKYNWIKPELYSQYYLSYPIVIHTIKSKQKEYKIYNEGKFIKYEK